MTTSSDTRRPADADLIAEARGFAAGSDSARATLLRDLADALEARQEAPEVAAAGAESAAPATVGNPTRDAWRFGLGQKAWGEHTVGFTWRDEDQRYGEYRMYLAGFTAGFEHPERRAADD